MYHRSLVMCGLLVGSSLFAAEESDPTEVTMKALQDIQEFVGDWEGSGKSEASKGWDEHLNCKWKFNKSGKVSLYFTFGAVKGKETEDRILDEAMISFDPEKKTYLLRAYKAGGEADEILEFQGERKTQTNLVFDRTNKESAKDNIDRLDIKLLNEGDRVVYTIQRRVGKSSRFTQYAQVGLDRKGTSFAGEAAKGPKCIVTGGLGIMTVSYNGANYPVCCTGCAAVFKDNPEKYLAKLKQQQQ